MLHCATIFDKTLTPTSPHRPSKKQNDWITFIMIDLQAALLRSTCTAAALVGFPS